MHRLVIGFLSAQRAMNLYCTCQADKADYHEHGVGPRCSTLQAEHISSFAMLPHHIDDEFGKGSWYVANQDGEVIVGALQEQWRCKFFEEGTDPHADENVEEEDL
eukprot:TRINITY_DN55844_c0_g1_i2.p1 TRINITY_DN55844_c0_g1~~TRINITY_DN55844_c0_g1_i2.p1  ORF type:complete len:105 (+),score=11.21 TRINITY_DN55844_c0_g1_i2:102-416(+)